MSVLVLAPIKAESANDHSHVDALRELLQRPAWDTVEEIFSQLSMLHMARFQIIDHLVPRMGDQKPPDKLLQKYLLFIAEIDGRAVDFYDHLYRQEKLPLTIGSPEPANAGKFVKCIWGHCAEYPQTDAIYLFRQFMQRYEFKTMLPYKAVTAKRDEILTALSIKELTAQWMAQYPNLASASPEEVRRGTQEYLEAVYSIKGLGRENIGPLYDDLFEGQDKADSPEMDGLKFFNKDRLKSL